MWVNEDGGRVAAMEVLTPRIGEITGGRARQNTITRLLAFFPIHESKMPTPISIRANRAVDRER